MTKRFATRFLEERPFADQLFIVTGAAGGIGWPTTHLLAAGGARLLLNDVNADRLEELAAALPAGSVVRSQVSDIGSPGSAEALVAAADGPIFGLVHLAGVFIPTDLGDGTRANYDHTMSANATNAFDLAVAALPRMQDGGTILFISSLAFMRGSTEHIPYSMAKGALVGLTRGLSRRIGSRGIRVNALAPGIILTDMPKHLIAAKGEALRNEIPMGRFGEAEDVADVIGFFCSPASRYVTGQVLSVDGGVVNG